jgi:hypothetical protein
MALLDVCYRPDAALPLIKLMVRLKADSRRLHHSSIHTQNDNENAFMI